VQHFPPREAVLRWDGRLLAMFLQSVSRAQCLQTVARKLAGTHPNSRGTVEFSAQPGYDCPQLHVFVVSGQFSVASKTIDQLLSARECFVSGGSQVLSPSGLASNLIARALSRMCARSFTRRFSG